MNSRITVILLFDHKQLIHVKGEPECSLTGTDKSTFFWGDNLVVLGWYTTVEDAQ